MWLRGGERGEMARLCLYTVSSFVARNIAETAGDLKGFFEVFQKCSPDAPQSLTS